MIIFVHFYFPFSVHCYIIIYIGKIPSEGELVLYSKWEPCPSCYYVISQFIKKYPNINFKIMYNKEYGDG